MIRINSNSLALCRSWQFYRLADWDCSTISAAQPCPSVLISEVKDHKLSAPCYSQLTVVNKQAELLSGPRLVCPS